jgi:myo-inositol-1(or 4)-monophosphatase
VSDAVTTAAGRRGEPSSDAWAPEVAFATELARRAGAVLMDRYERVERIDYKSARDVVTEADHESEALIIEGIRARFPGDAILAEESGEHRAVPDEAAGAEGANGPNRTWVIDPLDGTVNYANGIPFFCVSVALVFDGSPVVGAVFDPTRDELFTASADTTTLLDGRPVRASDKENVTDFVVSMALGGRAAVTRSRNVRKAVRIPRSMGSAALALAYVANGRFDAFIQQGGLSAWDVAAAGLIAERGGATVSAIDGGRWFDLARPPRTIGILAAPPRHHRAFLDLVREPPPTRRSRPPGTVRA